MRSAVIGGLACGALIFPTLLRAELEPQILVNVEEPVAGAAYTG